MGWKTFTVPSCPHTLTCSWGPEAGSSSRHQWLGSCRQRAGSLGDVPGALWSKNDNNIRNSFGNIFFKKCNKASYIWCEWHWHKSRSVSPHQCPHGPEAPEIQCCPPEVHSDTPGSLLLPSWSHPAGSSGPSSLPELMFPTEDHTEVRAAAPRRCMNKDQLINSRTEILSLFETKNGAGYGGAVIVKKHYRHSGYEVCSLARYLWSLYLYKGEHHGRLTGSDLLLGLAQLASQSFPLLLQYSSCTSGHEILIFQCFTAASRLAVVIVCSF